MRRFRKELLLKYLTENKMSKAKFCKESGLSLWNLNKLLAGRLDVGITVFGKLCDYLKTNPESFFEIIR